MTSKSKFIRKSIIKNKKTEELISEDILTKELEKLNIKEDISEEAHTKNGFKFDFNF